MHRFINEYSSNNRFKLFIDDIIDIDSRLWEEYIMLTLFDLITSDYFDSNKIDELSVFLDTMIVYFEKNEEYEKCNKLKLFKTK